MSPHPHEWNDQRVVRALRRAREVRPSGDASAQAVGRAIAAVREAERAAGRPFSRRLIMQTAAAMAAAALIAVVALLAPQGTLTAPTWADVQAQTARVRVARIDAWTYVDGRLDGRDEFFVRAPDTIRVHEYDVVAGEAMPRGGSIATPRSAVRWNDRTRRAERASTENPYMVQADFARMILGTLGMADLISAKTASIEINGDAVRFEPIREKHPHDATLRGFALRKIEGGDALPEPFDTLIYWFDADRNVLRRLSATKAGGEEPAQWYDAAVEFDPVLPPGFFNPEPPAGYAAVDDGLRQRLSPEVREVYDAAAAARERFGDYRAVIWRDQTGGWPSYREAKLGGRWRIDVIEWGVMHAAMHTGNAQGFVRIASTDPFETLWQQVTRPDYALEMSALTHRDRYAIIHYNLSGRGPRTSAKLYDSVMRHGYDNYFGPALRQVTWPEWMATENLHPHGWDLREPMLTYRLLPPDPANPNLIDVVGERDFHSMSYVRYTLDRSRDYLCVRREIRDVPQRSEVMTVLETAQTADGRWYPKRVQIRGHTYDYAIDTTPPEERFFEWPAGVPQPEEAFNMLRTRQTVDAQAQRELPATAKGKYTTFEPRGLPRGFADKATADAYSEMASRMRRIQAAVNEYASDHDWVYPPDLRSLTEVGLIEPEHLKNPLHPDADPPYVYIRPDARRPNNTERIVLHEPLPKDGAWPGVISVMFGDGSVEHIHDEAEFRRLIAEATSPEPPRRAE